MLDATEWYSTKCRSPPEKKGGSMHEDARNRGLLFKARFGEYRPPPSVRTKEDPVAGSAATTTGTPDKHLFFVSWASIIVIGITLFMWYTS
jgi:hypothetical protein